MRTWTRLIPAVLVAVPFTWSSLRAAEETADQKIKKLQDDVAQIQKDLESIKKEVKDSNARGARVAEDLEDIKTILRDIANRQAAISRQSAYGPAALPPAAQIPATGAITVQNNYSSRATVRINGRPYDVGIGQSIRIRDVPTGAFQYSVDVEGYGTVEQPRTDTLPAAGYRITIYPKMMF